MAIGSGGYYGEERIGDNYDDDDDGVAAIGDWKWWLLRRGVVPITVVASPTPRPSRHALTSYIVLTLFFSWTKKVQGMDARIVTV